MSMSKEAVEDGATSVVNEEASVLLVHGAKGALREAYIGGMQYGSDTGDVPEEPVASEARPTALGGAYTTRGGALGGEANLLCDARVHDMGGKDV